MEIRIKPENILALRAKTEREGYTGSHTDPLRIFIFPIPKFISIGAIIHVHLAN
uniref:Uncharacterized protein n=1 Tax=Candidatus Kentrum sp. LFY TaxID=2126342 RepID=A0A450UV63_9GAMM|nr:MAG: hypothetical protein BECKLFY1418B_GA0070995_10858 [Candidatus Kentron sp. LFY]